MDKRLLVVLWAVAILVALFLASSSSKYLNYNENVTIPPSYPSQKAQLLLDQYFHGANANNTIDVVLVNASPEETYQVVKLIQNASGVTQVDSIVTAYLQYDEEIGKAINFTGYQVMQEERTNNVTLIREQIARLLHVPFSYTALFNVSPERLLQENETAFFSITPPSSLTSLYVAKNVSVIFVYTKYGPNFQFPNGTYPSGEVAEELQNILSNVQVTHYLTGPAPLVQELSSSESQREAITFVLVFVALLVITGAYFRSPVAPLITLTLVGLSAVFGMAVVTLVGLFYQKVDFQVIEPLISVLLGIGTDYSVFLLSRFREELGKGASKEEAAKTSLKYSGKAILISGVAVTFVFLSLSFIPFMQTWGLTIGLSVPITVALAYTLLPLVYGRLGEKMFWPSRPKSGESRTLRKLASASLSRPKTVLVIALIAGLASAAFVLTTPLSLDFTSGLPNIPAVVGLKVLENAFGNSFVNPVLVVFNSSNVNTSLLLKIASLERNISSMPGVTQVIGPVPSNFNGTYTPEVMTQLKENVGTNNRTLLMTVVMSYNPYSPQAEKLVEGIQKEVTPYNGYVGGTTASVVDALNYLLPYYTALSIVLPIVLVIALAVLLRSVRISLGAVSTILLSIAVSLAIIYLLFRNSEGVLFFIPITVFILMMGLGNDYSTFILVRVKEEVERTNSIEGIVRAISISAGAVTALGVILAASFGVLGLDPIKPIAELGIGIALAALIDTFVIRIFVYPALLKLLIRQKEKVEKK
ncbi:MAG: antibiotic transport-associated protein [Candidatus Aramenus sulfurataquae]|uniref:Antibiotic transport-associated protein n=4 Tax=Candidatus Aramenus sulfurataquae TaxID=1326980 RepID=W7KVN5_9CREN|nr:MAG: antibiotic transport-associated protein [Candidatus Aramenus sulfurataquae]